MNVHHLFTKTIVYVFIASFWLMPFPAAAQKSGDKATGTTLPTHPGALHSKPALTLARQKVAAKAEPWFSTWNRIKNEGPGITYQSIGLQATVSSAYALQNQGHDIYLLAVKWAITGDTAYSKAAINAINNWVNTVTAMTTDPLRTGIGAVQMANAAEILATSFNGAAGWSKPEVEKAKTWMKAVVWPRLSTGAQRSSNWGTSALAGCMAVAVFCDDNVMFNYAVSAYKNGFSDAFKANGKSDGCAGVSQYIAEATGQSVEAGRDQGHPQGGVGHLVETAFMAYHQGVNITGYADNRLTAGMEYLAKYNLGNDVPYNAAFPDPCDVHPQWPVISPTGRGAFSPVYEISNKLFTLTGIPHPFTQQVIQSAGYLPEKTNTDHTGLGTLLFRY